MTEWKNRAPVYRGTFVVALATRALVLPMPGLTLVRAEIVALRLALTGRMEPVPQPGGMPPIKLFAAPVVMDVMPGRADLQEVDGNSCLVVAETGRRDPSSDVVARRTHGGVTVFAPPFFSPTRARSFLVSS